MRKTLFTMLIMSLMGSGFSQVGIDTENPTETLHVNGEVRIQNLPSNGEENVIYTDIDGNRSAIQDQTFNATKTVVADNNGVLGTINTLPSQIISDTSCYASTTRNFAEVEDDNGVALITVGDFSFRYDPTTSAATSNFLRVKNNSATSYYGLTKGDRAYNNYVTLPTNEWRRFSDNINFDAENTGEILFFTDVDATETLNTDPHFYSVKYFTQKRTANSYPSVCINVTKLN